MFIDVATLVVDRDAELADLAVLIELLEAVASSVQRHALHESSRSAIVDDAAIRITPPVPQGSATAGRTRGASR